MTGRRAAVLIGCIVLLSNVVGFGVLAIWRIFVPTSRVADQSLVVAMIVGIAGAVSLVPLLHSRKTVWPVGVMAGMTGLACGLIFLQGIANVAINVDRSRSLFVLQWVSDLEPAGSDIMIERATCQFGPQDPAGLLQRLREHEQRGLIAGSSDALRLTSAGRAIVSVANVTAQTLNLAGWKGARLLSNGQVGCPAT